MLRKALFCFLPFLSVNRSHALEAVLSHSVFYLPDPIFAGNLNPYMEAYWQVNPKTVHYNTNADKGIVARIQTDVLITNGKGKVIKEDHYIYQTVPRAKAEDLAGLNILEVKRYFITTGTMKMRLKLTDLNDTSNKLIINDSFMVDPVPVVPFFGSIELVDTFYESDIKTPFRKHDKQYIPLCVGFYDNFKNTLSYYSELYRLDKVLKKDFPFYRSIYISKKENDNAFGNLVKIDTVLDDQDPYVSGTFDIDNLPSGNYYLNISLGNIFHQTIASQSVFFQRFNTHQKKEVLAARKAAVDTAMDNVTFLNLNKTFVIKYTLPQLRSILKMLLPLTDPVSTRSIDAFLKKPDEMYMRYFIYNFFLGVNRNNPGAAWDEYAEKVKEANKLYTVHGRPGYETARGFMFLRYGAPSEVVTESNERGSLPYEIWQYNTLKEMNGKEVTNAVILFYKGNESDFDYKLLHTTIDGETHNAGWRSFLYNQSDGGTGFNSRAEQYIGNR